MRLLFNCDNLCDLGGELPNPVPPAEGVHRARGGDSQQRLPGIGIIQAIRWFHDLKKSDWN